MPEHQELKISDRGLCEHGNFKDSCAACKEGNLDNKEDQEKVNESQENNGYVGLKDSGNTGEEVEAESGEVESIFQNIKNGNFDVKKWGNIPLELRRAVVEKTISSKKHEDWVLIFNLIEDINFKEDDNFIAILLLKNDDADLLIKNKEKFVNLNFDHALAEKFIDTGAIRVLLKCLDMFNGLDLNSEFADKIISRKENGAELIVEEIWRFNDLSKEIAYKLTENGFGQEVLENFAKFPDMNLDDEFSDKLVKQGVAQELFDKAKQMTDEDFLKYYVKYIAENPYKGFSLNRALVDNLTNMKDGIKVLAENFSRFKHIKFDSDVAYKMIEQGFGFKVVYLYPDSFPDLVWDADLANVFIKGGELGNVVWNYERFSGFVLDGNIAEKCIEKGEMSRLLDQIDEFSGMENLAPDSINKILEYISLSPSYFIDFVKDHIRKFTWLKNEELIFKLKRSADKYGNDSEKRKFVEIEEMFVFDRTLMGRFEAARTAPKDKRSERLKEFKADLCHYKEWWAQVTKDAIELIRNSPDIAKEKFLEWFYKEAITLGFDPNPLESDDAKKDRNPIAIPLERLKVEEIFDKYQKEHGAIKRIRAQFPDNEELYEHLYGSKPVGKIEIIEGASNLHIRCWNLNDYTRVYYGRNKTEELTSELINQADRSGGVQTKQYFKELDEDIIITAEKNKKGLNFKEKRPQKVFVHEEQHAIYELFKDAQYFYPSNSGEEVIEQKDGDKAQKIIESELRKFRMKLIDGRARNEILAYYKDGTGAEDIKSILLETEEEEGLYDYASLYRRDWKETARIIGARGEDNDIKKYLESAIRKVFTEEYRELIDKSVNAFAKLQSLYGTEKTVRLLTHEPLDRWVKITERMLIENK